MGDPAGGRKPVNGPDNHHPGNSAPGGAPRLQACAVPYRWEEGEPPPSLVPAGDVLAALRNISGR